MIEWLANDPSEGLFFVQQHAWNAMPSLLQLKGKIVCTTRQTVSHTEDLEDSILAVRSMSECGLPIADHMINDIARSLRLVSASSPRRGLIQVPPKSNLGRNRQIGSNSRSSYSLLDELT